MKNSHLQCLCGHVLLLKLAMLLWLFCDQSYAKDANEEQAISLQSLDALVNDKPKPFYKVTEIKDEQINAQQCIKNSLIEFNSDQLTQYALMQVQCKLYLDAKKNFGAQTNVGTSEQVNFKDLPTIIFLHGFHPHPYNYGRIKDGTTYRPGDYYRKVTRAFTEQGFIVLTPDYRGHNDSQGQSYTTKSNAWLYYLRDSINFIKQVRVSGIYNNDNLFIVGHSMGASIGLLTSLLLSDEIKSYSLWAAGNVNNNKVFTQLVDKALSELDKSSGS